MSYPPPPHDGVQPPMTGYPPQAAAPQAPGPTAHYQAPPGYTGAVQTAPPPTGSWQQTAGKRSSFLAQVRVEFRKLAGTTSNRVLLIVGPLVLIGLTAWMPFVYNHLDSVEDQIMPVMFNVRLAAVVLHAVLIKLVAGEWQHRSAQPTLLVQPSRLRYFGAQTTVLLLVWLCIAVVQYAVVLIVMPIASAGKGSGYLLDYRLGWLAAVVFLGALMAVVTALVVSMLIPNAAGALALYFGALPAMLILFGIAPKVFVWVDPLTPAMSLAGLTQVEGPAPPVVALLVWAVLLGLAVFRVSRRELA